MKQYLFSFLAALHVLTASASFGECTSQIREYIANSGGNKEAAIAHTRKLVADSKTNQSNAFWKQPKSYRQEMFAALDEEARELISSIRSCTDSDLASITPKAKASQSGSAASNCPAKIVVVDTGRDYYGMHDLNSYELVSTNPISIRANSGTRFLNSLPGSPAGDQWGEGTLLTDINSVLTKQREVLDSDQKRISSCSQGCCDSAASLCSMKRDNQARMVEWLQCVAKGSSMSSGSAVAASTDTAITQAGPNVGNASEVIGQRSNRKNAFNPGDAQTPSSQSASSGRAGKNESRATAYASKDATHCVEVVPKGFKGCTYSRCLHNACGLEKISVWWKGGGGGGGLVDLAPGRNWPVNSIFDNGEAVNFAACSWDKSAPHGPQRNPCHY